MNALIMPGAADWDEARKAWNLAADQRPYGVAIPKTATEVAEVVNVARSEGLRVAAQSTGHHAMGMPSLENTILLKTSELKWVDIDADKRLASCGSGAIWIDVAEPASRHGLAALAGSSPDVGVTGYSLGGGVGWLARRYGLATNSVTSIDVVTADGELRTVDRTNDAELFWALRGGGGSFGVVTAMEFQLYAVPELYAGWLIWPMEQAADVLNAWARWLPSVPDEVTSFGRFLRVPPMENIPAELRGRDIVAVQAAFIGDATSGEHLLRPLRELQPQIDTFSMVPPVALSHLNMDPPEPIPAIGEHRLLRELPPAAIDGIVGAVGAESGSSMVTVEIRHLGGALRRPLPDAGALAILDGSFLVFGGCLLDGPDAPARAEREVGALLESIAEWDAGRRYPNFSENPDADPRSLYPSEVYERLRRVKSDVDPGNVFVAVNPIPSA